MPEPNQEIKGHAVRMGDLTRTLRNYRELSQETLSDKTGISQATLSKIESGIHTPSYPAIIRLCKHMNCDIGWFMAYGQPHDVNNNHFGPYVEPEGLEKAMGL